MSFLGNLSSAAKPRVYLSVTPEVGLEMIQLDFATCSVANYAVRELAYNEANRDIADYDAFKAAFQEMLEELNISPKCDVVISLPLVNFGLMQFPLHLGDNSINGGIQSEVEQAYLFRRAEPAITWQDVPSANMQNQGSESRQIVYAAIQKEVIAKISEALSSVGAHLVRVENSLTSTLRALDFAGYTETQMQSNVSWNLMIINGSGYSIVSMNGKNVIDYYEEPLAVKSFEGDEIYNAINQSAQIALMSSPANYLFIVSDTDQVSASLLASKLQTQSSVTILENNSFKKESVIPVGLNVLQNYAPKVSLQAVGSALSDSSTYPLALQFGTDVSKPGEEASCTFNIGEKEITLTANAAIKMVGIAAVVLIAPLCILTYLVMPNVISSNQSKLDQVNADMKTIDEEISQYKSSETSTAFDLKTEVERGIKANRSKLMNYTAAGDAIPKNVWLTYFMTQGDGLIDVKGVSSNVEEISLYFKNLKDSLIGTKLRLQKLEMDSQSVDDVVLGNSGSNYSFEITNMTSDQLSALMNKPASGDDKSKDNGGDKNSSQQNQNNGDNPPASGLISQQPIQGN